jgi:hypothetical protein
MALCYLELPLAIYQVLYGTELKGDSNKSLAQIFTTYSITVDPSTVQVAGTYDTCTVNFVHVVVRSRTLLGSFSSTSREYGS